MDDYFLNFSLSGSQTLLHKGNLRGCVWQRGGGAFKTWMSLNKGMIYYSEVLLISLVIILLKLENV
jgi:hypothetical protein